MIKGSKHSQETRDKISKAHMGRKGKKSNAWKGGKITIGGYIYIYSPRHPNCTKYGYVCEHRLLMEKKLKRLLKLTEIVHHIDGNPLNNDIKNLVVLKNKSEHRLSHPEISEKQKLIFKGKHFSPSTEFKKKFHITNIPNP